MKLTDAEIVKGLKNCATNMDCDNCNIGMTPNCVGDLLKHSLDLINRQKAEIERLQKAIKVQDIMIGNQDLKLKGAKNEAIKEFAERLKYKAKPRVRDNSGERVFFADIDNLVKEMVGD